MKQIWSKSLACLLCLALLVGMLPMAALAEDNPPAPANDEVSLLAEATDVKYLDENGGEQTCPSATVVDGSTTTWNNGWYVVNSTLTIDGRIEVTGDVHLILADGCTLNASQGINVSDSNSLTIYAQSAGENMGVLTANGGGRQAGIGGGEGQSNVNIIINGGKVTATGGTNGAGIGGGYGGSDVDITINGGRVTANGGDDGAGIGGGHKGSNVNITINGGRVTATGGISAAGIGGGYRGSDVFITINGGRVTATGDSSAVGIGGGNGGKNVDITIKGGTVIANGGWKDVGIGGIGPNATSYTFSTDGSSGHAVIFASSFNATFDTSSWSGVIFQGTTGNVYGTSVTPTEDFTIPANYTLTIDQGQTLIIPEGVTIINNGTINGSGTIQLKGGSTVQTGENGPAITVGKDTTGATVGTDGSVTLPNGGSATIGSGENTTTITTSGGSTIKPNDDGTVTIPDGSTVQTGAGPAITIGEDTTGATVGTDGSITLPENGNVTIGSDDDTTTITTPGGGTIKPNDDGSVTIPGGSTVITGDGTSVTFPPKGGSLDSDGTVVYTVTVTFDSQGGSEVASKDINVNNPVEEPAAPTRSGYSFRGWYTAASGGERWDFTKPVAADMTLYAQWSWINVGGPTYPPTMDEPENGAVTTSPSRPEEGDTVTITPKPDEGFEVDEILVKDENGKEIKVTQNPDGTYTFTQPDGKVTIKVTFRCDGGELCPGHHLTDVSKDAWYHAAVDYVVEHGIMEGMSATTFSPNTEVTRAQAVQILYNLEGQPDISSENLGYPYEDVNAQAWYGDAVYWARITGVATGYGDGTFQPTDSITRQEFAQMLYNYAKYKGYDLSAEGDLSTFPDAGSIADWAEAAMSWANGNELINGHDNGTIDAGGTAIRAQAASILMQFDQNLVEN